MPIFHQCPECGGPVARTYDEKGVRWRYCRHCTWAAEEQVIAATEEVRLPGWIFVSLALLLCAAMIFFGGCNPRP